MPIRQLPILLVNQIAAGEVIERPASVVKELIENSLDAGATDLQIAVEDGGKQLIRISDNGSGIVADELPLAIAPHATSKLKDADQLATIATMGFRGEALASIASVSRLRISSRATIDGRMADAGAVIEAAGDRMEPVRPEGGGAGTVIEVRDLFFNTPARRKFLRSGASEFGHISELIGRTAMLWPHVSFKLFHNGRTVLELTATDSPRQRCLAILGPEMDEAMLEFEQTWPLTDQDESVDGQVREYHLWGLAGLPEIARATAKFQYFAVNRRPVRDRQLNHALREAYRGLMAPDRQPVAVVFIDMPLDLVDVNVHPAKTEVRFRDPAKLHGLVLSTVKQRLLSTDLTPGIGGGNRPTASIQPPDVSRESTSGNRRGNGAGQTAFPSPHFRGEARADGRDVLGQGSLGGHGEEGGQGEGWIEQAIKRSQQTLADEQPPLPMPLLPSESASSESVAGISSPQEMDRPNALGNGIGGGGGIGEIGEIGEIGGIGGVGGRGGREGREGEIGGVLQVDNSYLVTQDEQGILVIDQHALHERVMFEQLRKRILGQGGQGGEGKLESQRLLMPLTLSCTPQRLALLEEMNPLLDRLGIEVQPLGPNTLGIQAFSTFLYERHVDPVQFMEELFDRAMDGLLDQAKESAHQADEKQSVEETVLHRLLDMMACKAAVKAGDRLSDSELVELLRLRREIERSSNCPHGRPTTIRLSWRDLEKEFHRV